MDNFYKPDIKSKDGGYKAIIRFLPVDTSNKIIKNVYKHPYTFNYDDFEDFFKEQIKRIRNKKIKRLYE